ncbi:hypothetical protein E6H28_06345 [Candidatus Bathyarchaeota archaeon]|nr:MAG: hypothetical protein E6H28_06345 [Candidatus Bathyarchaeota archaeon]
MKSRILALLAITLVAAASPAMIALASGVSQAAAHANHSTGPPGTIPCTFDNPGSLPSQASANATDALADRSTHCPPTIPTQ